MRDQQGDRRSFAVLVVGVLLVLALGGAVRAAPRHDSGVAVPAAPGFAFDAPVAVSRGIEVFRGQRGSPAAQVVVARVQPQEASRVRTVLSNEQVAEPGNRRETVASTCRRMRCVAAVNGDYWFTSGPFASTSVGAMVSNGELINTGPPTHAHLLIGADGGVRTTIDPLPWTVQLAGPRGALAVEALNRGTGPDGIVRYSRRWGPTSLSQAGSVDFVFDITQPVAGGPPGTPLALVDRRPANAPIGDGQMVLTARGAGVARVDQWLGGSVDGGRAGLVIDTQGTREAIGGSPILVTSGNYGFPPGEAVFARDRNPHTMLGWTAAGELLLATVDGRQSGWSVGATLVETAQIMRSLGAIEAINLDGGGSTTFVQAGQVLNRPSDRLASQPGVPVPRSVANAVVIGPPEGFDFGTPSPRGFDTACPPGSVPPSPFSDVDPASTHGAAVACVAGRGIARGISDTQFAPRRPVTRDQMAAFLARLLAASGFALPENPPERFADDGGSVHARAIDQLAAIGVVSGRADGSFGPRDLVTRGQMASFLVRTDEVRKSAPLANDADYFVDDSLTTHERSINQAAQAGYVAGVNGTDYLEGFLVTREQMATFLARVLDGLTAGQPTSNAGEPGSPTSPLIDPLTGLVDGLLDLLPDGLLPAPAGAG
ncbi:hypothetical protein BH20ACT2_BH20ACT2_13480 [soil metagenome]